MVVIAVCKWYTIGLFYTLEPLEWVFGGWKRLRSSERSRQKSTQKNRDNIVNTSYANENRNDLFNLDSFWHHIEHFQLNSQKWMGHERDESRRECKGFQ